MKIERFLRVGSDEIRFTIRDEIDDQRQNKGKADEQGEMAQNDPELVAAWNG